MDKGCADRDEPNSKGSKQIEVEPEHNEIECAMDSAMQCAKYNEDPRSIHVYRINLLRNEEVQHKHIEKYRNLEQVL